MKEATEIEYKSEDRINSSSVILRLVSKGSLCKRKWGESD